MRDLQSMFFESRTRLERIETRRAEQSSIAQELWSKRLAGLLPTRTGAPFAPSGQGMLFRCTLTPLISMEIDNFPDRFLISNRNLPQPPLGQVRVLVELPSSTRGWSRRYRAVEFIGNSGDSAYWRASLEADGLVNQISIVAPSPNVDPCEGFRVHPGWYGRVILQGMILTLWLRQWAGHPDIEYVLDGEFINSGGKVESTLNGDILNRLFGRTLASVHTQ